MITLRTYGSLIETKIWKDAIGIEYDMQKKFWILQKKPHSKSSAKQFGRYSKTSNK